MYFLQKKIMNQESILKENVIFETFKAKQFYFLLKCNIPPVPSKERVKVIIVNLSPTIYKYGQTFYNLNRFELCGPLPQSACRALPPPPLSI